MPDTGSADAAARHEELEDQFGEASIRAAAEVTPERYLDHMAFIASIDADFAQAWVDFIYGFMYSRGVLDERVRELTLIAELVALGDATPNMADHMRNAMRGGATIEEILEVILQSCIRCGMPKAFAALHVLKGLAEEDNLQLPAAFQKRFEHLWPPQRRVDEGVS